MIRKGSELIASSWDEAIDLITGRSRKLLDSKGPLSHGFYTLGQLMLEEYYTLAVIGKSGIGTPHMDGNTGCVPLPQRIAEGIIWRQWAARLVR
jgi:predicted molibdopterin-dependent oxidoreductase YjgC